MHSSNNLYVLTGFHCCVLGSTGITASPGHGRWSCAAWIISTPESESHIVVKYEIITAQEVRTTISEINAEDLIAL